MADGDESVTTESQDIISIIKNQFFFTSYGRIYFPLEIGCCNGNRHKCFTKARIVYTQMEDLQRVRIFPLEQLLPAVCKTVNQLPDISEQQKSAVLRLEEFIKDYKSHEESLVNIGCNPDSSETDVCTVLAVHLFSKLIPDGEVIVNKDMKGLTTECSCGCKTVLTPGDTGIGNKNIWHGHPDILVNHTAVTVRKVPDEEEEEEDEHYDSAESNKKMKVDPGNQTKASDIFDEDVFSQVASQAITNGFAQKNKLNSTNQLIPAILCTVEKIMILFYDPDNDILLRRLESQVLIYNSKLSISAVIELWIVLNLHLFQPSLPKSVCNKMVQSGVKASFAKKGILGLYEKSLVGVSQKELYLEQLSILTPEYIKGFCTTESVEI